VEIYLNSPTSKEGVKQLNQAIAKLHATLLIKKIDNLKTNNKTKKKIVKKTIENLNST